MNMHFQNKVPPKVAHKETAKACKDHLTRLQEMLEPGDLAIIDYAISQDSKGEQMRFELTYSMAYKHKPKEGFKAREITRNFVKNHGTQPLSETIPSVGLQGQSR